MYLCNHRSWGDFFMDQAICNGGAYLSRLLVIIGCPMSSLYAYIAHSTWFFNRKKGIDRDALGEYIQSQWLARPNQGLIVYPEGTRNLKMEPLRLKTGVLKMAFDYQRPVQAVITTNKERVANEKDLSYERNVSCVTSISPALEPHKFESFEAFVEAVREQFVETWEDAYSCKPEDAIAYDPPYGLKTPTYEPVPYPRRVWYARIVIILIAVLVYASRK
ncbi:1-acyl-sn-glycerol-3-phosphate acyltransferase [Hondaea fermentalgiana]|uniref:1-acyl-sn-glycerol-3-phosphate acyltransferase n=1 Tax=Hondaea fermentalgiana TaxID=2315210 RepID=A0A2R5GV19_9STRA|nr:1-acyl-sn-glycerol-3-phosphate acyltransferase [Hondaea fermentalgiana]|eukprot:GBG34169.1 1-acyl-sn-glycerol-3-phosphate acyltransferase [Hondaea fermentalgiana]